MSSDEENDPHAKAEYSDQDDLDHHQSSVLSTGRMSKQVFSDVLPEHHQQPEINQEESQKMEDVIQPNSSQPIIETQNALQNDEVSAYTYNKIERNQGGNELEDKYQTEAHHFQPQIIQNPQSNNNIQEVSQNQQVINQNEALDEPRQNIQTLPEQGYSYEPKAQQNIQVGQNFVQPAEPISEANQKTAQITNNQHIVEQRNENINGVGEASEGQGIFDGKTNLISAQLNAEHGEIEQNQTEQNLGKINEVINQKQNKHEGQIGHSPLTDQMAQNHENIQPITSQTAFQESQKLVKQQEVKQLSQKAQDGSEDITQYSHNQLSKVAEKKDEEKKIEKEQMDTGQAAVVETSEANLQVSQKPLYQEQNEKYGQSVVSRRILAASVRDKPKKQEEVGKANKVCQCSLM